MKMKNTINYSIPKICLNKKDIRLAKVDIS